jgi:Golgi phosphoprotein 3 (GPP34)
MAQDLLVRKLFLIFHNPFTGKPEIGPELLRCGLVAAAFADLVIARRVGLENDRVVVAEARRPDDDEISGFILDSIQSQPTARTVRSWAEALADAIYELAAHELATDGVVRRQVGGRRLLRRSPDRFPALDLIRASGPRVRLEHMLRTPRQSDIAGATIAAIIGALEVERILDVDRDRAMVRTSVAAATESLPMDLRALITGVTDAVSAISLVVRR